MLRSKLTIGLGAVLASALTVTMANPAAADLAPTLDDVVGVGSDTVQTLVGFGADGSHLGDVGYNSTGPKNRLVSFDSTPDANARAAYDQGSTAAVPKPLNGTIIVRQGLSPILRPNGSSRGIGALINDNEGLLNFARSSRPLNSTEIGTAGSTAGVGPLRTIRLSNDDLVMARSATVASNAPAALTIQQLVGIYECTTTNFNQVGGSAGTIVPYIPQNGSGTRGSFTADLTAAKGSAIALGGCVVTSEEHDPAVIRNNPNAIAPFSAGRKNLYDDNGGYFNNPANNFEATQARVLSGISLMTGAGAYKNTRGLFVIFRQSDINSPKAFQPGGALNFVRELFFNPGGAAPFFATDAGAADISAAGSTPAYLDCGVNVTTC